MIRRPRAYSDSPSPPPSPPLRSISAITSLTQSSLAQVPSGSHAWPFGTVDSYEGRVTSSSTSVSDGEYGEAGVEGILSLTEEQIQDWVGKGKGKGKEREEVRDTIELSEGSGLANSLPPEILGHIFRLLSDTRDLQSALLVSRTWCLCAFSLLWHKPTITKSSQLVSLTRVIASSSATLPYTTSIRRLNLTSVAGSLSDDLLIPFEACSRVERLALIGVANISRDALRRVVSGMKALVAVDLSQVGAVEEQVMLEISERCERLQGLNLSGCKMVVDEGMKAIAERCRMLRRVKLGGCLSLTDVSLVLLVQKCPLLLELDLAQIPQLSNPTLHAIFLNAFHLRELRLNGNINLSDDGIPNLPALLDMTAMEAERAAAWYPWYAVTEDVTGKPTIRRPIADTFEHLRLVDLTGCEGLGDVAIDNLVTNAPKMRSLTLAKCVGLTDAAVESIGRLGKHLHFLHLGHVSSITDAAVIKLARSCTRLRYIDFACCPLLTDVSVFELAANLPKLRRIGLVKVTNLTDEGIHALVERHSSLERIHLSYCELVSVNAVTFMLNRLLRLTHLSLTGVTAFRTPELQQFCRPAPIEFNAHQQSSFCVYSGHGITALRNHLNSQSAANQGGSDDASTRRGSGSSTSSITVPGGSSPPPVARHLQHIQSSSSSVNRRGSAPALRDRSPLPGLNTAFASSTPNFLSPIPIMPGSYHLSRSARGSRNSSTSSVPEFEERPRPTGPRFPTSPTRPIMGSTQGRIPTTSLAIDRIDAGSRNGSRGANDAGGSSSSPLRWVAGMVGWGGTIGEDDGLPPRGERR